MDIIYLRGDESRPPGDTSPLIECIPGKRGRGMEKAPGGEAVTITIGPSSLNTVIAELDRKGERKVYVRLPPG